MKNLKKILLFALVLAVMFYISQLDKCNRSGYTVTTNTIEHKGTKKYMVPDTVIIPKYIPVKDFVYIHDTIKVTDTVWVYGDYFTKRVYNDTIISDTSGFFYVSDTIYMNRLYNRSYIARIHNVTKIIKDTKGHFYVGANFDYKGTIFVNSYYLKNRNLFTIGISPQNYFSLGYAYKIK